MSDLKPIMNEAYREYAGLLLRRHRRLEEGKDDDPETEDIEERMLRLWGGLDKVQRQSLNGIGSDLNWVLRQGRPAPKARRPEEVTEDEKRRLREAEKVGDWHAVLHWLRVCVPAPPNDDA